MPDLELPAFLDADDHRKIKAVVQAALAAVDPEQAVRRVLRRDGNWLMIGDRQVDLDDVDRLLLVGVGKAALAMGCAAVEVLGERLSGGVLITKVINSELQVRLPASITVLEGDHPVPGERSISATQRLLGCLSGLTERDLVIGLISGGGSALLTWPVDGVTLEDMQTLTRQLLVSGATINELNAVRRRLDRVKGGGLARAAYPAAMYTLILSDVIGSPLEVIASGPTVEPADEGARPLEVLERYQLARELQPGILRALTREQNARDRSPDYLRTANYLVASNETAARAALAAGREQGFDSLLLTTYLEGEAREAGGILAGVLRQMAASGEPVRRPGLIVVGGETTVHVNGQGIGGRNLEVALGAVEKMSGLQKAVLVTLATDGEDGPTDAAGAVVTGETQAQARAAGLSIQQALMENDSYTFFARLGGLIRTGSTGTNVNDLAFLISL